MRLGVFCIIEVSFMSSRMSGFAGLALSRETGRTGMLALEVRTDVVFFNGIVELS